jgi:hypothetical protein
MKRITLLAFVILSFAITSCKKKGSLTVTVTQQSAGQQAIPAVNVIVLVRSVNNSDKFYMDETSAQGVGVIRDIDAGEYKVSSQVWDGSDGLNDEKTVIIQKGKDLNISLLLQ